MSDITDAGMAADQREQAYREATLTELQQQTKHLFTIQAILSVWLVLSLIAAALFVVAALASSSSGY